VAAAAKSLDGQEVCMDARLRPIQQSRRTEAPLYEFVPLGTSIASPAGTRIGLVGWDKELGIDERANKPATYGLIEAAAKSCPSISTRTLEFKVRVRGVVMHRKNLVRRAREADPAAFPLPVDQYNYDVEFVLLEIVKATAECTKR
jgi:hypothetical protein